MSLFQSSKVYSGYVPICSCVQTDWRPLQSWRDQRVWSRCSNLVVEHGENNWRSSPQSQTGWRDVVHQCSTILVRSIGDLFQSWRNCTVEDLLQRLGEKNWRSAPSRGGTVEEVADLLQCLGEKNWRSSPSRGWIGGCGPRAPASWCTRRRRQESRRHC